MSFVLLLVAFWDYSYTLSNELSYNNNIFNYSPDYIADFMNEIRPYRFPFDTYDDLITSMKVHLRVRNKFFTNKTTTFNLDANLHHYLINQPKDYQYLAAGIRQSFGVQALKFTYSLIPHYLIRYYQDPRKDSTNYIGCAVTYHTAGVKLSWQLRSNTDISLTYKRKWDNYVTDFNLYDANGHIVGIDTRLSPTTGFTLHGEYEFRISTTDSVNADSAFDDIPDGAFTQNAIEVGCVLSGKIIKRGELYFVYRYAFRNYASDEPADVLHFGRQDHYHKMHGKLMFSLMLGMQGIVSYTRQMRNATSEVFPNIDNIKNFDTYEVSAGLLFQY